uniref:Ycf80 n=1 Tax=Campylaephora sungminbooi TaxID=1896769 RepID=A0A1B0TID2_9FLOR|nr:hypothetical protein BI106_gp039 [Campylaephora sungminbooi]AKU47488.1 hypothetical protein [Campylaephora sungminbooi]ALN11935.1 hypothetical protein 450 [Campylaephora sungminbooi]
MFFYSTNNSIESIKLIKSYSSISLYNKYAFQLSQFNFKNKVLSNSVVYKFENNSYRLISRNFFIELVNKFWKETIFLSVSDSAKDIYIEKLKSDGLSIYSNDYKNFLCYFSKALINDRIHITSDFIDSNKIKPLNNIYTKYIWKKGFNFSLPTKNSYFCSLFTKKHIFNSTHQLSKYLSINKFPIFTVINNLNQIILSESSNEILVTKNLVDHLYNIYSKYFLSNMTNQIKYQALFFISSNDAKEYQKYIKYKNSFIANNHLVNLFITRLDVYYYLMKMRMKTVDFRLIPDLEELGNLVSQYQHYKNIKFHKNQYFEKQCFQGQPIYFIEPVLARNKNNGKIELIQYIYNNDTNSINSKYTAIFMNYKTSLLAWQKFKQQMFNYHLPNKPNLLVYNLEQFIKQYEKNPDLSLKNLLFVPSVESYFYLKNQINLSNKCNCIQKFVNKSSYLKIFSQRIVWSLTSRQPINW